MVMSLYGARLYVMVTTSLSASLPFLLTTLMIGVRTVPFTVSLVEAAVERFPQSAAWNSPSPSYTVTCMIMLLVLMLVQVFLTASGADAGLGRGEWLIDDSEHTH